MNISLLIGTVGFVLYFIYDINSIKKPKSIARYFFGVGSIFVCGSFVYELYVQKSYIEISSSIFLIYVCLMLLFTGLLIYTLFFCFDAEETYLQVSRQRTAYTKGMYALCRHPGVLWFTGCFVCLYGITRERETFFYATFMILYNVCYVILQDVYVFPRTFINYREYQQETPFLMPNIKSVRRCFTTRMRGKGYDS